MFSTDYDFVVSSIDLQWKMKSWFIGTLLAEQSLTVAHTLIMNFYFNTLAMGIQIL